MPKLLNLFFLIAILLNIFSNNLTPANLSPINLTTEQAATSQILSEPGDLRHNVAIGACLLAIVFLGVYQAQIDQMPESLKSQFKPQNIALNLASTYCMNFACTFFHELGHGIAKKVLTGGNFKIHLGKHFEGKNSENKSPALLDSKYLSLDGLDPIAGFNKLEKDSQDKCKTLIYTSLQTILINLAGGVSGILGYYLLRTAMYGFSQAITFDPIVLNQLFNTLIPTKNGGDANKIWQELGIKNKTIQSAADIQQYMQMLAFIALSFKQSDSDLSDKKYIADKFLIGLANYFLHGFAQFKST